MSLPEGPMMTKNSPGLAVPDTLSMEIHVNYSNVLRYKSLLRNRPEIPVDQFYKLPKITLGGSRDSFVHSPDFCLRVTLTSVQVSWIGV